MCTHSGIRGFGVHRGFCLLNMPPCKEGRSGGSDLSVIFIIPSIHRVNNFPISHHPFFAYFYYQAIPINIIPPWINHRRIFPLFPVVALSCHRICSSFHVAIMPPSCRTPGVRSEFAGTRRSARRSTSPCMFRQLG